MTDEIYDARFDRDGNVTPDGEWHLCGCGDLIPLDKEDCDTCRAINEMTDHDVCLSCDEPILPGDQAEPIGTPERPRWAHTECLLRNVMGGIGHLIAHEYWCQQRHDPDAGLTYRQSARLVRAWVEIVGHPADEEPGDG